QRRRRRPTRRGGGGCHGSRRRRSWSGSRKLTAGLAGRRAKKKGRPVAGAALYGTSRLPAGAWQLDLDAVQPAVEVVVLGRAQTVAGVAVFQRLVLVHLASQIARLQAVDPAAPSHAVDLLRQHAGAVIQITRRIAVAAVAGRAEAQADAEILGQRRG